MNRENEYGEYLGDGVYAHFDGWHIMLTTGHHNILDAHNIIALEPEVLAKLDRYRKDLAEQLKTEGEENNAKNTTR